MIGLDWNPTRRTLRQFAAVAFAFLVGITAIGHVRGGSSLIEALLVAAAVAIAVVGWFRPEKLRLLFVLLSLAVFPIGYVLSHFILLFLFYGVITPLGVLGRLARPDPMKLGPEPGAPSYWRERRRPRTKASYLRQA
ncbi:MAG: hypothetical protein ACREQQ_13540 [Candidatus Binatia bacterium]